MGTITEEEQQAINQEVVDIYNKIIQACDNHSYPAIKASLLMTRDYFIRLEALQPVEKE